MMKEGHWYLVSVALSEVEGSGCEARSSHNPDVPAQVCEFLVDTLQRHFV